LIVHDEIAILGGRIAPGYAEDGMALSDEVADQRILRRQVEDVVFHNPGRDDQHRLGQHRLRRRSVLDELDQMVSVDDFSRRGRDVLPNKEILCADRRLSRGQPAYIFQPILNP